MTEEQEAEAPEESTADESDDDVEGLAEGDFVRLEFTARTVEGDQLVDTTDPEVAEEEGIEDQGSFEPRTIVLGEGHLFESVEDEIVGGAVGDEGSVVVAPEEAFGEYDQDRVRTVSVEKIDEDDRYPGAQVQVDGEQGYVETVIGGRARVDFNHPLAGEEIEYDYEVIEVVEDRIERARGLFAMYLDEDLEMWIQTDEVEEEQLVEPDDEEYEDLDEDEEPPEPEFETVETEKETLYIEATPQLTMNQQWMFSKQQIAGDVVEKLDLDRVVVQEVLDGGGMGMPGMMGGMGGGGGDVEQMVEEAVEEADVDAEEVAEELEGEDA